MEGTLNSAIKDLATSGITPQVLGVSLNDILQDILPLSFHTAQEHFPQQSSIFKGGELRPNDGYFWAYNGTVRFKNLDAHFHVYKDGKPVLDKVSGLPRSVNYLSSGKSHLYMSSSDVEANTSTKGFFWFTEGEKKKKLLTYLFQMRLQHQATFRVPYLNPDYKYGVFGGSGVFNFLCTPEWESLQCRGKPIMIAFDADWETNTAIPLAELKLVAGLIVNGASLKKIKSLYWPVQEGKGIDDYLLHIYIQTMGESPAFETNGDGHWKPCISSHPMLSALNRLLKMAVHPFQKYESLGIDFLCQAIASIYRHGIAFKKSQEEEIISFLKSQIFTKLRLSVIRATFSDAIKKVELASQLHQEPFLLTEQRTGERFAEEHKEKLRWSLNRGVWLIWNGKQWKIDTQETAYQLAKRTLKGLQTEVKQMTGISDDHRKELFRTLRKECEKVTHKTNMLIEARRGTAGMTVEDTLFDSDPYILNCQNGMLHLNKLTEQEGGFGWHSPHAYCSELAGVSYEPSAQCPQWVGFLNMIFDNVHLVTEEFLLELQTLAVDSKIIQALAEYTSDIEFHPDELLALTQDIAKDMILKDGAIGQLGVEGEPIEQQQQRWIAYCQQRCRKRQSIVDFVQQCVGLGLTGLSTEKIFLFCYGPAGDNGKTTFFNVIERLLGSYFYRLNIDALLYTRFKGQNNDEIADMKGKRMVVTSEVSESALNVSLIKTLTGAEGTIKACRKYEHPVAFTPSHTLWMFGNQMPRIQVVNDPIWNRIKVIRFTVRIPDVLPKDQLLPQNKAVAELCRELPGILNWALRGWLHYQTHGLLSPKEVELESLKYQSEQDRVGLFLTECCIKSTSEEPVPDLKVSRRLLYREYIDWCESNREKPVGKIKFYHEIEQRGFQLRTEGKNLYFFHGIGLRNDQESEQGTPFA